MNFLKLLLIVPFLLPLMAGSCESQTGQNTDTSAMDSRPTQAMRVAAQCPKARNAYGECVDK